MKHKLFLIIVLIGALFLLLPNNKEKTTVTPSKTETRGVFLSYIELQNYLQKKDEKTSKHNIKTIIQTMKKQHFNWLILQVRPFSDAIYPSKIFPSSKVVVAKEGDPLPYDYLKYFIQEAHKEKIKVHAWVNPYRVSTNPDPEQVSILNPAYSWLGTSLVEVIPEQGIYYNPASEEVKKLILSGIEELINHYDIDGIHFDDYFYPSKTIDLVSYEESGKKEPLYTYRLNQVNDLVKRTYKLVHKKKNLVFGISPQGNIENNYQSQFADVRTWATTKGYVDYLMPQIYYGFLNEAKPYYDVVKEWNELVDKSGINLYFTLALYKTGVVDTFAKSGANEWLEEDDIIKKEIIIARNLKNYKGFSLYRYDYLVQKDLQTENTIREIKNLQEILN